MKVKITTDVQTCIPKDLADEKGIDFVEFYLLIGDESVKELSEIDREQFIHDLKDMKPYPTSSMPSPQDYVDTFEKAFNEGYDEILHIGLSFNISNALNSATIAAKKFEKKKITIYDCGVMGPSEGIMVLMADKLLNKGKTVEEVINFLDSMKGKIYGIGCSSSFDIFSFLIDMEQR